MTSSMVSNGVVLDYENLVQEDRVHSAIFTDPAVFEQEMQKIYGVGWVYVGHSSEIPEPGDYATKSIGRMPIILVRDEDRAIRLLINRCRHRGSAVCQYETGNSMYFTCPYHGFTYSSRGDLVGVPGANGYDQSFRKEEFGLTPVPRMGSYRGFIFGSLSPQGISLEEHMSDACRKMIDLFCDGSPTGEIIIRAGVHKHQYRGNWKQVGMDGYHAPIVHQSWMTVGAQRAQAQAAGGAAPRRTGEYDTRDLGRGHAMLDMRSMGGTRGVFATARTKPWFPEYQAQMQSVYGKEWSHDILRSDADPHLHVYPNVQLIGTHIRVIYPVSAGHTIIYMYPALYEGVPPELNELRLRAHENFYGPASGGNPDDYEVFERTQLGMQAQMNPWIYLGRGFNRQRIDMDEPFIPGTLVADGSDEVTQRGQLARWKQDMMAE